MQQSPSREANSTAANQAIQHIVWNLKVHTGTSLVLSYPLCTGHHPVFVLFVDVFLLKPAMCFSPFF